MKSTKSLPKNDGPAETLALATGSAIRALHMLLENSAVITPPDGDPCFVDLQCRAADYEAAYDALNAVLPAWTQNPPTEQGEYWHWNGDEDCAPLPMFVLWSGFSGKCFVSQGQLGLTHAIDCDQYGGWWLPLYAPPLPNVKDEPRGSKAINL